MFDDIRELLFGCVYTIFTPFHVTGEIDYETLGKYIESIYKAGGRKFYAMAYNSRYSQLTHPEILDLNQFCINKVKSLDSNNLVIVGDPIHCSTAETIEFSNHAKDAGADLISLLVREKYFSDDQILDHFAEVGRQTGMGILVHEMPFLSGFNGSQMHWPRSLLMALPKIPQIVALKEDAKDPELTRIALELEPRVRVVIAGRKSEFIKFKPYGARAYLNGVSIVDARVGEAFWTAYEADDQETIEFIIDRIEAPFFDRCVAKYGWHRTNKALLETAGLMRRHDRMPLKHLSAGEFVLVEEVYQEIKMSIQELLT